MFQRFDDFTRWECSHGRSTPAQVTFVLMSLLVSPRLTRGCQQAVPEQPGHRLSSHDTVAVRSVSLWRCSFSAPFPTYAVSRRWPCPALSVSLSDGDGAAEASGLHSHMIFASALNRTVSMY